MSSLSIVSIVGTGDLGVELDLGAVANDLDCYLCQYNPDKFAGLYLKFYEDAPAISVYRSGSFSIRGASEYNELSENNELLINSLNDLDIDVSHAEISITNIVHTGDLGQHLNLNELAIKFGLDSVEYEPEQFPGLVYRLDKGVSLIFSSGKIVLTGFTKKESAEKAYQQIKSELEID